jgi:signal peptidase II
MIRRRYVAFAAAALFVLVLDQASKMWARAVLRPIYPGVKTVITGIWEFRYSENQGAAFGFMRQWPVAPWIFASVGIAVVIGALIYLGRAQLRHPILAAVEIGFIAGGAAGNMTDRVLFHHVTDFVVWKWHGHEWFTFNVADAALVVGIISLILDGGAVKKKAPARA